MTEAGHRVLSVLSDGTPRTIQDLSKLTQRCQRMTRGTVHGCLVSGLVTTVEGSPTLFVITDEGLELIRTI